jgi:ribonuclease P protein component
VDTRIFSPEPNTLPKEKRLRKRRDYVRVQRFGSRVHGKFLVLVSRSSALKHGQLGITVPKSVGAAHQRNKVKRRLRHIFRYNQNLFLGMELVAIAKEGSFLASFTELSEDIMRAAKRIDLKRSRNFSKPKKSPGV